MVSYTAEPITLGILDKVVIISENTHDLRTPTNIFTRLLTGPSNNLFEKQHALLSVKTINIVGKSLVNILSKNTLSKLTIVVIAVLALLLLMQLGKLTVVQCVVNLTLYTISYTTLDFHILDSITLKISYIISPN